MTSWRVLLQEPIKGVGEGDDQTNEERTDAADERNGKLSVRIHDGGCIKQETISLMGQLLNIILDDDDDSTDFVHKEDTVAGLNAPTVVNKVEHEDLDAINKVVFETRRTPPCLPCTVHRDTCQVRGCYPEPPWHPGAN